MNKLINIIKYLEDYKRELLEFKQIQSAHSGIFKFVYFTSQECASSITQIAYTVLKKNDVVKEHCHISMEEVFLVLEGDCSFVIDGNVVSLSSSDVIKVPPGTMHQIYAKTDCKLFYFGVSV